MQEDRSSREQLLKEVRFLRERLENLEASHAPEGHVKATGSEIGLGRESILHSALDCILTIDATGKILEFNPAAEQTFGYRRDEVLGKSMAERIIPPWLRKQHEKGLKKYIETGHSRVLNKRIEIIAMRSSGEEFPVELAITPDLIDGRQIFTAYVRDLTERKRSEEALHRSEVQLRDAQKMEVVGRLAGGIAHDFNNLLTVILGCSELIQLAPEDLEFVRARAIEIQEVSQRASDLTQQLLTLSRRHSANLHMFDINATVREAELMLQRVIPERISVTTRLGTGPLVIFSAPSQLNQVILNLTINAQDAIKDIGTITLTTREKDIDELKAEKLGVHPGTYVVLEVSDTGCGMPPEVATRAFEPFFTTKEVGQGSGLGLATVYGIVKQSHGAVEIESEEDQGTLVQLYFPQGDGPVVKQSKSAGVDPSKRGIETILIVEDEERVRDLMTDILRAKGYRLIAACNGADALRIAQEQPDTSIDLLISDMVMPVFGGRELAEKFSAKHPTTKILLISGYTEERFPETLNNGIRVYHLDKPFSASALAAVVRKILDEPG